MEDQLDIPEESMRHIEALLARHPPQMIQRMFAQTLESRKLRTWMMLTELTSTRPQLHIVSRVYQYHCHELNIIV